MKNTIRRLYAFYVLWSNNVCTKHGHFNLTIYGCYDCRDEAKAAHQMKVVRRESKQAHRIRAAKKVLGL